jgi:hypothetical protein
MKRVLIVLLAVVCLFSSCECKQTTSMENSEAGQLKTEMLSQQNTVGIEQNSPQINSRYHGIDFSTQPFAAFSQPPEILEQIPQDLIFITQPAYFIKSNYMWEIKVNRITNIIRPYLESTT